MKKLISAILAITAIVIAGLSSTSCLVESLCDATIMKSVSFHRSYGLTPKPGVTSSEIDAIVNNIWNKQNCEMMGDYLVLRNQHNDKAARAKAEKIGAEIEAAIKKQWPDISDQLSEDYTELKYEISYEFNGKTQTVWTFKIR